MLFTLETITTVALWSIAKQCLVVLAAAIEGCVLIGVVVQMVIVNAMDALVVLSEHNSSLSVMTLRPDCDNCVIAIPSF